MGLLVHEFYSDYPKPEIYILLEDSMCVVSLNCVVKSGCKWPTVQRTVFTRPQYDLMIEGCWLEFVCAGKYG